MEDQETHQIFTSLGLTTLEAKVYLALAKRGESPAKTISKASKVSQPDVYRVLTKLEDHGLIERIIAIPRRFRATPMDEGLALLLQRRDNQSAMLHKKATELAQSFKANNKKPAAPHADPAQFILVPGVHVHRIRNAVDNAQNSVLCFTSLDMFRKVRFVTEDVWKKGVQRNVKFQFIIGKPHDKKVTVEIDPTLENNDNFEIKFIRGFMPCMILTDEREIFLRTEMNLQAPVLWSNNALVIAMIENYFKTLWEMVDEKQ